MSSAQIPTPQSRDSGTKQNGEYWKNKYFERFPNADTNGDGSLSWKEHKAHKNKIEAENRDKKK